MPANELREVLGRVLAELREPIEVPPKHEKFKDAYLRGGYQQRCLETGRVQKRPERHF